MHDDVTEVIPPVIYAEPGRPRRDWWERPAAAVLWLIAAGLLYLFAWMALALGKP